MSSKKKRPVIIKQGLDGWVMTYGDMMSLLLTFFVLIVSFSSMQEAKFKDAAMSLRKAFGVMVQPQSVIEFNDPLMPKYETQKPRPDLLTEVRELERALLDRGMIADVEMSLEADGVRFRLEAPVLFEPGSTQLKGESLAVLDTLATFLTKFPGEVRVDGHSDATPIRTASFPSNWELSAARSGSVARYFQQAGLSPERIAATGYGEHRPLATNDTAEGRARNRRVEIFLQVDRNQPPTGGTSLSGALDRSRTSAPRPTPVTDRLRRLDRQP
jgi:chemotaxis protein MotB